MSKGTKTTRTKRTNTQPKNAAKTETTSQPSSRGKYSQKSQRLKTLLNTRKQLTKDIRGLLFELAENLETHGFKNFTALCKYLAYDKGNLSRHLKVARLENDFGAEFGTFQETQFRMYTYTFIENNKSEIKRMAERYKNKGKPIKDAIIIALDRVKKKEIQKEQKENREGMEAEAARRKEAMRGTTEARRDKTKAEKVEKATTGTTKTYTQITDENRKTLAFKERKRLRNTYGPDYKKLLEEILKPGRNKNSSSNKPLKIAA